MSNRSCGGFSLGTNASSLRTGGMTRVATVPSPCEQGGGRPCGLHQHSRWFSGVLQERTRDLAQPGTVQHQPPQTHGFQCHLTCSLEVTCISGSTASCSGSTGASLGTRLSRETVPSWPAFTWRWTRSDNTGKWRRTGGVRRGPGGLCPQGAPPGPDGREGRHAPP